MLRTCLWISIVCFAQLCFSVEIPDWAKEQISETQLRLDKWKGTDNTLVFPFMTDTHSGKMTIDSPMDFSDSKIHLFFGQQAAQQYHADFFADLGDMDLENMPRTQKDLITRLESQDKIYGDYPGPVLFAIGNHDHGRNGVYTSKEFGERFNGLAKKHGHKFIMGPNSDYGFYDIPLKKCRVFFLNTSDDGYYGYSQQQLQFLADNLKMEAGWTAVVLQHFCIQIPIGYWKNCKVYHAKREEIFIRIVEDFVAGKKGSEDNINWDFTGNKQTAFAGCFFGDSHFDNYLSKNGVNYTISQGYGGIGRSNLSEGAVYTNFKRSKEMLIDVVAIKPSKRQVKIFRIGAGGKARDREYTY